MKVRSAIIPFLLPLVGGMAQAQSAAQLIAEGDSLLKIDRPQKAADKFTQAIEKDPSAASYSARARAWYYMERMDRFLLDVEKALKLDSLDLEANYQRALYASRGEDHAMTDRLCSRALDHGAKEPLRYQLLVLRGGSRAESKNYSGAVADLTEALGTRTEDIPALKTLARAYDALGDHAASLHVLETLCTIEPEDIGNWTNRGFELASIDRYEEAITVYGEALALDKDEPTALSDRAYALLKLGRESEALVDIEHSLKGYPANAFALRTRGILRLHKGEKEKACADLQLARIIGGVPEVDKLIEENCAGSDPKR